MESLPLIRKGSPSSPLTERLDSDLLRYIVKKGYRPGDRLPSLEELSQELEIGVGRLREQLGTARSLGLVEVRPRTGVRLADYDFSSTVRLGLFYSLASDPAGFSAFHALRDQLESAFWHEAVQLLTDADKEHLHHLVVQAQAKLNGDPIVIPHAEHRDFHLTTFVRLSNPFVTGLLSAYWDAYEAVGLSLYSDYSYLQEVWRYHARIAEAIQAGDPELGRQLLIEHAGLLSARGNQRASISLQGG
jgi:DNA-binding FadR family transcriptional regulator